MRQHPIFRSLVRGRGRAQQSKPRYKIARIPKARLRLLETSFPLYITSPGTIGLSPSTHVQGSLATLSIASLGRSTAGKEKDLEAYTGFSNRVEIR